MTRTQTYIKAARPRTLPLSVSGIILGSFLAHFMVDGEKNYLIFILAFLTTVAFQILSNFANDYGDGIKGTDANRIGEQRMVSSGLISYKNMKLAVIITSIISLVLASILIYVAFGASNFIYSFFFFSLGILAVLAAIKYTVGRNAYGYSGFGDVFVFIFFGLVSVCGTYFLYTKSLNWLILLPAISIGLLSTAVLNLNNMRDIRTDAATHKNTLALKLGAKKSKRYHYALISIALKTALLFMVISFNSWYSLLGLVAFIPLVLHLKTVKTILQPEHFDPELKKLALSTVLLALLIGVGYIL
ncbi:1,4-dihydroxy-2-naphthoate octaprenyltransferase [Aurantibacter aestuarii]|uniref:1,4-dihydroxy-2-naphthoate octaprenyltransferase n=1 Tax=Aurantibacter aestuarii TaxID=1266046 RepID=A0A2T1N936_9FLAO|nr:1,4-dihydroxy-2-naphthoate octaprenyltransferase [Aurantibacter aestuarii]PSG88390.1 1,4-dihydroxy-2-naphthoate octaprenyltransferase [Aurantibacter aestuarii]